MFLKEGEQLDMNFKKVISFSLCSAMIISLAGCNPKDTISNILTGNNQNEGGAASENNVVISEKVNKDAVFKEISSFTVSDKIEYIDSIGYSNGRYYIAQVVYDYGEMDNYGETVGAETETGVTYEENADIEEVDDSGDIDETYADDYDIYNTSLIIASFTNKNDLDIKEFTWDSPNAYIRGNCNVDSEGNYYLCVIDYDLETGEERVYIKKMSPSGEEIKSIQLKGNKEYFYVNNMYLTDTGIFYVLADSEVIILDKDLNETARYREDGECYIQSGTLSSKGELTVQVEKYNGVEYETSVVTINAQGKATENEELANIFTGKEIVFGRGYDYILRSNSSIFAFNDGDKAPKEIVNFYDSDIDPNNIYGRLVFKDAEHFIAIGDMGMITDYEKVPADQVKDKEIITLGAVWGAYDISSQIINYNKTNDTYRIKLIDYSEYSTPDDWMAGIKRFNADITGGNAPDIIIPETSSVQNLIDKGVFTDLTPLMNAADGVKKEDLVENAQTMFADGEELYCVYPSFYIDALLIKESYYKEGMTIDDVIEWENKTGCKAFESGTKSSVLDILMRHGMDAFLDPKTGKCSFDSEEFIKLLDYANTYPVEINDMTYDEDYYKEYMYCYRNDKALYCSAWLADFADYNWNKQYRFGDAKVVLTGVPVEGSKGSVINIDTPIGISAKSKNKEAAWDFVKTCFTDEYYEKGSWSIPTVEKKLDERIRTAMEPQYFEYEDGTKEEINSSYWLMDEQVKVELMGEEEAAKLKSFVTGVNNLYYWDDELNTIVDEETQPFFQGQKSAKEVAGVIQSRLQIYINEKK